MEKTKKIANGFELEILLVAGLVLPVLAGAALCLFQFFAPNAPNAFRMQFTDHYLSALIVPAVLAVLFYFLWFLFVLRIWRTLFPKQKILPFLFLFTFLPVIGPTILLPLSILIPARKRSDRTFLWSLLLILLVLVLELQIFGSFFPIFGSYFITQPQFLNIFLATLIFILVAGAHACRGLAGRRPDAKASLLCGILILILAGEYLFSTILLRSERAQYENAVAALEELRVPLDDGAMRDFYQNGSPFDRERTERLQSLIETAASRKKEGKAPDPGFLGELDSFAGSQVPVKDPVSWRPPMMRPSRFAVMPWDHLFQLYRERIALARASGENEKILPLLQQEQNILQTFFDEPAPAVFETLCGVLDKRAGQMEDLLRTEKDGKAKELPLYMLAAMESVFREDEESLQYALRRLCFHNSWYAEKQADRLAEGSGTFFFLPRPNVERAQYALGAPVFQLILADQTRTAVLSRKLLDAAPWDMDYPSFLNKYETLKGNYCFSKLMNNRIDSFGRQMRYYLQALSRIRGARALAAAAAYRTTHEGKIPENSFALAEPLTDPVTGKPFNFYLGKKGELRIRPVFTLCEKGHIQECGDPSRECL